MKLVVNTDGAVRTGGVKGPTGGKSGPGSIGYVIRDEDGNVVEKGGMYLDHTTVNCAEWSGVICGLAACARLGATDVVVRSDSQLVVMQANGVWAVRDPELREYYDEVKEDSKQFESVTFEWVPRAQNSMADQITREVISEVQASERTI